MPLARPALILERRASLVDRHGRPLDLRRRIIDPRMMPVPGVMPLPLAVPNISYVGAANSATSSATPPAHRIGDFFLAFATTASTTIPALGTGFTSLTTGNEGGGSGIGWRIAHKFATSDGDSCSGFTNAASLILVVFRDVNASTPIGTYSYNTGTGTTLSYPARVLANGKSFVIAFGTMRNTGTVNTPSGMTNAASKQGAVAAYTGPTDTFAGTTGTSAANVIWIAFTLEVRGR